MKSTTIVLTIVLLFLLLVRLFFYFVDRDIYRVGDRIKITHSLLKEPKKNSFGQYFFTSNMLISIPLHPRFSYGDTIEIEGVVSEIENEKGKLLTVKNPKITLVSKNNPFMSSTIFARNRVIDVVTKTLPLKESGLFLGIVLGVRDRLESTFYEHLRDAGVLHIIAASGQNISILASILLFSFEKFVKRKYALLFTALLIFFYTGLVGFDPPIVRASIMAVVSFGALALGRQNSAIFALFLTGWGMAIVTPSSLTDISFQLSFLSTFGILTIKPLIERVITFRFISILKDDLTTTLSAQIATFPIMVATFGAYSLLTLPVNLLILWTIPFLMTIGVISLFISIIMPILAKLFVIASYPLLAYFVAVVEISERYKWVVEVESVPTAFICGYYLILIAIVIRFRQPERRLF